jgi:hypothetical protein
MSRDFGHWFEPFIIFTEDKLGLRNLAADGEPPIANIVLSSKKLNAFSSKAKAFYDIVDFGRLGE